MKRLYLALYISITIASNIGFVYTIMCIKKDIIQLRRSQRNMLSHYEDALYQIGEVRKSCTDILESMEDITLKEEQIIKKAEEVYCCWQKEQENEADGEPIPISGD